MNLPLGAITIDPDRLMPGMDNALRKVRTGEIVPQMRRGLARELVVREEALGPAYLEMMKANTPVPEGAITVVARANGRLWASDAPRKVRAGQVTNLIVYAIPYVWLRPQEKADSGRGLYAGSGPLARSRGGNGRPSPGWPY